MAETAYYSDNPSMNMVAFGHLQNTFRTLIAGGTVMMYLVILAVGFAVWGFFRSGRSLGWDRSMLMFGAPLAAIGILILSPIFVENIYRFTLPAIPFFMVLISWLWVALSRLRIRHRIIRIFRSRNT